MPPTHPLWSDRFAPKLGSDLAANVGDQIARYLGECLAEDAATLPSKSPQALYELAAAMLASSGDANDAAEPMGRFGAAARLFLDHCHRVHSPKDMGHQVSPSLPVAAAFDALASFTNQGLAVAEMGPFAAATERVLIDRLAAKIGWGGCAERRYGGIVTGGGTIANLTAILAARNARYRTGFSEGMTGASATALRPALITSADSHYSIARAAGILGIGTDNVLKAPIDARRRVNAAAVERTLARAQDEGLDVFCIVASACTTATGSFDDIAGIADVARRYGIWLHVDGAHGASMLFSPRHAGKLRGIDQADSITWDAHKMMHVPSLATFLLYRDAARSFLPFEQEAPYLFRTGEGEEDAAYIDAGLRTLECTKRGLALGAWGLWAVYGEGIFREIVETTVATTRAFYETLLAAPDFAPVHEPECNILCFRHIPPALTSAAPERVSALQAQLRQALMRDGEFYLSLTKIDGVYALRTSVMNPLTTPLHHAALLAKLRRLGSELATA